MARQDIPSESEYRLADAFVSDKKNPDAAHPEEVLCQIRHLINEQKIALDILFMRRMTMDCVAGVNGLSSKDVIL